MSVEKYSVGEDPFEQERKITKYVPPKEWFTDKKREYFRNRINATHDRVAKEEWVRCLVRWEAEFIDDTIYKAFEDEVARCMEGRSRLNRSNRCTWGTRPLPYWQNAVLAPKVKKKMMYDFKIHELASRLPRNLDEAYLFIKYILMTGTPGTDFEEEYRAVYDSSITRMRRGQQGVDSNKWYDQRNPPTDSATGRAYNITAPAVIGDFDVGPVNNLNARQLQYQPLPERGRGPRPEGFLFDPGAPVITNHGPESANVQTGPNNNNAPPIVNPVDNPQPFPDVTLHYNNINREIAELTRQVRELSEIARDIGRARPPPPPPPPRPPAPEPTPPPPPQPVQTDFDTVAVPILPLDARLQLQSAQLNIIGNRVDSLNSALGGQGALIGQLLLDNKTVHDIMREVSENLKVVAQRFPTTATTVHNTYNNIQRHLFLKPTERMHTARRLNTNLAAKEMYKLFRSMNQATRDLFTSVQTGQLRPQPLPAPPPSQPQQQQQQPPPQLPLAQDQPQPQVPPQQQEQEQGQQQQQLVAVKKEETDDGYDTEEYDPDDPWGTGMRYFYDPLENLMRSYIDLQGVFQLESRAFIKEGDEDYMRYLRVEQQIDFVREQQDDLQRLISNNRTEEHGMTTEEARARYDVLENQIEALEKALKDIRKKIGDKEAEEYLKGVTNVLTARYPTGEVIEVPVNRSKKSHVDVLEYARAIQLLETENKKLEELLGIYADNYGQLGAMGISNTEDDVLDLIAENKQKIERYKKKLDEDLGPMVVREYLEEDNRRRIEELKRQVSNLETEIQQQKKLKQTHELLSDPTKRQEIEKKIETLVERSQATKRKIDEVERQEYAALKDLILNLPELAIHEPGLITHGKLKHQMKYHDVPEQNLQGLIAIRTGNLRTLMQQYTEKEGMIEEDIRNHIDQLEKFKNQNILNVGALHLETLNKIIKKLSDRLINNKRRKEQHLALIGWK